MAFRGMKKKPSFRQFKYDVPLILLTYLFVFRQITSVLRGAKEQETTMMLLKNCFGGIVFAGQEVSHDKRRM